METLSEREASRLVNRFFGVGGGYLGDFSYRTHTDLYPEYIGIYDIFPVELEGANRQRLMAILVGQTPGRQAKILCGELKWFPPNLDVSRGDAAA